ncbi:MAG: aldehyde dehydrogenase family protein [Betaproteobacteria bacterium]|nr:aldehyde dehydrogenase family protein [Betaproteobacteria bacterium]
MGDALTSAFEAAGQRCSALRILCIQDEVADPAIEMLKGGMAELTMGHPALLETDVGPVIDVKAQEKIESHIRELEGMGRRVHRLQHRHENDLTGTYVAPTIIEIESIQDAPNEIFGPVLHVLRYARTDLDQLLLDINATGYALTFGVHSRIDEAVQKMTQTVHAGNVYVNRNMVGAVVGVQAFGGDGLSGTGPKAGGPLYLLRLLSACPDDAALRSVQRVGGSTLPPTTKALEALYNWAISNHRTQLAQMCARFSACNPAGLIAEMKGPTGEINQYFVNARPHVLCSIGTQASWEDDLLIQLAAICAIGSKAIVLKDLQSFVSTLPMAVQDIISFKTRDQLPKTQAVLMHGSTEEILKFSQFLSQREGPLASLIGLQPGTLDLPLSRLVQERSISVNTTAAGGNASLMSSVS